MSTGSPDPSAPSRPLQSTVAQAVRPTAGSEPILLARPTHDSDIGTLGRYRVKRKLGEGAMGVVYLAYDTALQRKVALKALNPRDALDPQLRERFLREARAAAGVRSPHVVTVYDVGEELGNPLIAMEYLKGYSVADYLASKGEVPMAHVLRIGIEIGMGLAAAHKLGIVHRDIKPANVWLTAPSGQVKLLDFGLARTGADPRLTASGAVLGTPAYMSPEQARGEPADCRSDLFSLGSLLYRLATGRLPFSGETVFAALTSLATETPKRPRQLNPKVPSGFEAIILRLLEKDPDRRFQTAAELVRALQDFIASAGETPSTESEPVVLPLVIQPPAEAVWAGIDDSPAAPSTAARRAIPWAVLGAGALLLLAAGALVTVLALSRPREEAKAPPQSDPPAPKDKDKTGGAKLQPKGEPTKGVPKGDPNSGEPKKAGPKNGEPKNDEPKVAANKTAERLAAEWVLLLGRPEAAVSANNIRVQNVAQLPDGPFTLTGLEFGGAQWVTDDDLTRFRGLEANLGTLNLSGTGITDKALMQFKDAIETTHLSLSNTQIGDDGLAHLAKFQKLTELKLMNTSVSAAGLAKLPKCKALGTLIVTGCKQFKADGLAALKNFAPKGEVYLEGSGVTIEDALKVSSEFPMWRFVFGKQTVQNGKVVPSN